MRGWQSREEGKVGLRLIYPWATPAIPLNDKLTIKVSKSGGIEHVTLARDEIQVTAPTRRIGVISHHVGFDVALPNLLHFERNRSVGPLFESFLPEPYELR